MDAGGAWQLEGPRRGLRSPDSSKSCSHREVGVVFTGQVPVEQRCGGRASVESVGKKLLRVVVKGRSEMGKSRGRRNRRQQRGESFFGGEVVLVVCWEREGEFTKERSLLVAQGL